jgi:3-hydroxyacyl-CoA dehydrogenase
MSDVVKFEKRGHIGVIGVDNPPVNALGQAVRQGLIETLAKALADTDVQAIVLIGKGRTFVAGADISEFGKPPKEPGFAEVLDALDASTKPVVAALHGTALGGGLELALGCNYRVAVKEAKCGLPEVKLGILPGAGGTQRLPRLIGVPKALEMIVSGDPINATQARAVGLLDEIVEGDLLEGALTFAARVAEQRPLPRVRDLTANVDKTKVDPAVFTKAAKDAAARARGGQAPLRCVEAVKAAVELPFDAGLKRERELFEEAMKSTESAALRHVFFAERTAAKIPDIAADTPTLLIRKVAILGAGTMGGGIAMVFANAGIQVVLVDREQALVDKGLGIIAKNYAATVSKGKLAQPEMDARVGRISGEIDWNNLGDVDLVIEAVFEEMGLKKEIFGKLDRICKKDAILATNTSTLDVNEIAQSTSRPEQVIGLHFFSPANVMRLLEIVRGKASSKEVIATCMQLSKKLGKVGVLVGNCRGFVGNRMFGPYRREAQFLVEEGASIESVDKALFDFGMAMGPLATGDLAGLDVGWRIRKEYRHLEKPGVRQPFAEDRLCELGRYGQKTAAGWYKYDENRRPILDPEVNEMVRSWAREAGIPQRKLSSEEIVDRCIYALVNEGARILEEGIVWRAVDIDIIYLNGYGFPAYRGGPMWYADTVGLDKVYRRISEFHQQHGELWEPAPVLKRLAQEGKTFAELNREQAVMA